MLATLAVAASLMADWPVDSNPNLVPLSPAGAGLISQAQAASAAHGLNLTWDGTNLNGVPVYGTSETVQNSAQSGWSIKGTVAQGITDSQVWLSLNLDYLEKLVAEGGLEAAVEFYTVIVHEWHHNQSHQWQIDQCLALPASEQAACQACIGALDNCLKKASSSDLTGCSEKDAKELKGKNLPEESRAAYASFVCLCLASCAAAAAGNPELAAELKAQAESQLSASKCAWNNSGSDQIDGCRTSTGCTDAPSSAYPPPLGGSEGFNGPPAGMDSCDCEQPPSIPDTDPCPPEEGSGGGGGQ